MRARLTMILVLAALLAGCGDDDNASTTTTTLRSTTTSGATSASTQVSATTLAVPGPELAWTRVPDEEGVLGGAGMQVVNSMAQGGPGLVVVGGIRIRWRG